MVPLSVLAYVIRTRLPDELKCARISSTENGLELLKTEDSRSLVAARFVAAAGFGLLTGGQTSRWTDVVQMTQAWQR
jgi:hypothetical protein